jgi:HAMP domain-containing protein
MDGVLDRLSIRSKIAVILIVPVLACAVLGALRVSSRVSTSRQADRVSKLTEFSLSGTHLAHELQQERGLSERYLDEPKSAGPAREMLAQRPKTDVALAAFRGKVDALDVAALAPSTKEKLSSALGRLSTLARLRRDIDQRAIIASGALDFYNTTVADVLNANRELAQRITDRELAQSVGAFVSLSRIRELSALERELVTGVIAHGAFEPGQYRAFTSMLATRSVLLSEFRASATSAQRQLYIDTVVGPEVQRASELENAVVASEGNGKLDIDPEQWWRVTTANLLLMHGVEQEFGGAAVARSQAIERSANSRAAGDVLVVLAAVALAVSLSLLVARSMLRPLRLLEATAKDVAVNRLPGVVAKLQRAPTQQSLHLVEELEPVDVPSRDEIGEVAAAFNAVHQVAVKVAAEQAALRTSIGEMFLNLARRSQSLIDRQIELIDDLEEEADSQTLKNLFQLDHLATRMRRNAENLIVLSGAEPPRRWAEPIPLAEIVRGAVAEVEDYQRVALLPIDDVGVPGHAVSDVIHMMAELIENATSFSPPGTAVRIGGQHSASGYVIEIEDRGLGMSDDELLRANQRLADPPAIDFAVSRMLGLFVVGRLAQRYGIRVQLRHSSYGGVTALVLLPSSLLIQLQPEPAALPTEPPPLAVPAPSQTGPSQAAPPGPVPPPRGPSLAPEPQAPPPRAPRQAPPPEAPPPRGPQTAPSRPAPARAAQPPPPQGPRPAPPYQPEPQFPVPRQPARAERLPIFEQARSEWFETGISAEHGPPRHQSAYPPLAARYQSQGQQPPVGQGPPAPSVWGSSPTPPPPPRPSRAVDDVPAPTDLPRRGRNGFTSGQVPPGPYAGEPGGVASPRPPEAGHEPEVVEVEPVEVTPLPPFPAAPGPRAGFPRESGIPREREAEVAPAFGVGPHPARETASGLPRRVPRANLAPGILEQRQQAGGGRAAEPGQRTRSPEEVRSLLATYRAGLERGRRTATSGEAPEPPVDGGEGPPGFGGESNDEAP